MSIFVQTFGSGADLVLIHGWGFHAGIWDEQFRTTLIQWGYRLHLVDLPGHGNSPAFGENIDDWACAISEVIPPGATWLGWSLGGMVSLAAATLFPAKIGALITICSAPRFVSGADWRSGINPAVLAAFGAELQENWRNSVMRFLTLQDRLDNNDVIRQLRSTVFAHPPTPAGLAIGLKILQKTDLRTRLSKINCPTLFILGNRDHFFPGTLAEDLVQLRPDWRISVLAAAGHIPFLTLRRELFAELADFLAENNLPMSNF